MSQLQKSEMQKLEIIQTFRNDLLHNLQVFNFQMNKKIRNKHSHKLHLKSNKNISIVYYLGWCATCVSSHHTQRPGSPTQPEQFALVWHGDGHWSIWRTDSLNRPRRTHRASSWIHSHWPASPCPSVTQFSQYMWLEQLTQRDGRSVRCWLQFELLVSLERQDLKSFRFLF
jgi:hypothetical protein